jgi:excisionase family DNA binding protein
MNKPPLDFDYTLDEVAAALGMSTRWVRDRIRIDHVSHSRYGRHIRFTAEQVAQLRAAHVQSLVNDPVTSGPSRRRSA